jgi:hypothetical protein
LRTNQQVPKKLRSGPLNPIGQNPAAPNPRGENPAPELLVKKKTYGKRGNWSEESMKRAIDAVRCKKLSIRQAGELYGIIMGK